MGDPREIGRYTGWWSSRAIRTARVIMCASGGLAAARETWFSSLTRRTASTTSRPSSNRATATHRVDRWGPLPRLPLTARRSQATPTFVITIGDGEAARRRESKGVHVVANDEFFQRKQAAAVLKHGVLERYMTVFASMTGSASTGGRVHYVDGYAGPGRYDPEDGQSMGSPGSPLLAAGTAARLSGAKRDLRCIFIERDPTYAANLRAVLGKEWHGGGTYEVKEGEVEAHLAAAVATAGADPLLVFLDPFGTALAYQLLVQQVMSRPKHAKTEILLNFNIDSVRRIGGRLSEDLVPGTTGYEAREATLRRVDGFLGDGWWRQVYLDNFDRDKPGSAGRAAAIVAGQFRARFGAATALKSIEVPIRRRPGHVPLFLMTLFYRHDAAGYQFADAASLANRDWRHYNRGIDLAEEVERATRANTLFEVDDLIAGQADKDADAAEKALNAVWTDRVAANIRHLMQTRQLLPLAASVADVYGDAFGVAGEKHLRAAWDRLANEGAVLPREKGKRMWSQSLVRATR